MNTQFKESFTKDLHKIRDKDLLNRAKAVIETVEQAQSLGQIPNLWQGQAVDTARQLKMLLGG